MPEEPVRIVTQVAYYGRVPESLLLDPTATSDECRLYAILTRYDYRQSHEVWPTQEELGKRAGWSSRTVRRILSRLEERGAIEQRRRGRKANVIYLLADVVDRTDVSYQEPLIGQPESFDRTNPVDVPLTNERKNERARAARVPIPFYVDEAMYEWARRECPAVNVDRETEKFVDFWRAKGNNATKTDWTATWRNWMRKASEGWK